MSTDHKVKLKSSDEERFEVNKRVSSQSETVTNMIEDAGTDSVIPLPKVEGKIIEFLKYHVESGRSSDDDNDTLFNLIRAAKYLNIKNLIDLTCQAVANMLTGKTPEEMRTTFNIKNDFTPEEEEQVMMENWWVFT